MLYLPTIVPVSNVIQRPVCHVFHRDVAHVADEDEAIHLHVLVAIRRVMINNPHYVQILHLSHYLAAGFRLS